MALEQLSKIKIRKFTIDQLKSKKFIYNQEYQRSMFWKPSKKQKLIDSILYEYPIGLLIFRELQKNKKFEVIDGQQRLTTIGEFMRRDCKWKTSKFSSIAPSMSLKEIKKNKDFRRTFEGYEILFICLPTDDDEQTCDIFVRMQEGVGANTAEKLNAMRGKIRNLVYRLSKLKFFEKTAISNYRFGFRDILSNICLLELFFLNKINDMNKDFPEFPDFRFGKLKKMYKDYKDQFPTGLEKNINKTFNFLSGCFGKKSKIRDAKFIENKGDFLQVYILASIISRNYTLSKKIKRKFAGFLKDFLANVINEKVPEMENQEELEKNPRKFYAFLRSKGQTKENLKNKLKIFLEEFFKDLKSLESKLILRDQKRIFEFSQRIWVYYKKHKGICQTCKKRVEWNDSSFHHKKFHSLGGHTTIDNCELLHKKCHVLLHQKKGVDNEEY